MPQLTAKAINKLNSLLKLHYMDWMQDWEIMLADPDRVAEFCDVYSNEPLDADEKYAFMRLIIASFDDYVNQHGESRDLWARIVSLIEKDYDLHEETVDYWSCLDPEETIDGFAITPLIRALRDTQISHQKRQL